MNSSFLGAKLGSNPSFIWHSIMEVQNTIKGGVRWRVGDGSSINIWYELWLPNQNNFYVQTNMPNYLKEGIVFSLMKVSEPEWVVDIVKDIFGRRYRSLILNTPMAKQKNVTNWCRRDKTEEILQLKVAKRFS